MTAVRGSAALSSPVADVILHNGKVITVDEADSVVAGMAVRGERILCVGSAEEVMAQRGPGTELVDLGGKCVLPGLIDSHTHPGAASLTELDHTIADMERMADVLGYVRERARIVPEGEWIVLQQVFITRLAEKRYPTRAELDGVAPNHPVMFRTGPDASLNSRALVRLKIGSDVVVPAGSKVEQDPQTGQPTGIVRGWAGLFNMPGTGRSPSAADRYDRLRQLIRDYNSVGLTSVADRNASSFDLGLYEQMLAKGDLTIRVALSRAVDKQQSIEAVEQAIRAVAEEPASRGTNLMLRTIGVKMFLDGGMLTGSAYMLEPWGTSPLYAIDDPAYRGLRFLSDEKLVAAVRAAVRNYLQFTTHSVGDGAVQAMVNAYAKVAGEMSIRHTRPNICHGNFISRESMAALARLGVSVDVQPAWLYLDAPTLTGHFGSERMRSFQPLQSLMRAGVMIGGGSDHMQKIGSLRSVNPYNPFLGMWTAMTRQARNDPGPFHPEEALTRTQAIRFYTLNNAYLLFQETETGSLETGKLADFVVLDRDILTCPLDEIRQVQVQRTYLGGRLVYQAQLD